MWVIIMDLLQLKYFCDAAKEENFSRTAKKFCVPASNISQMVKRLEKELGVELFERKANKIVLNEYGKSFYKNIKNVLKNLDLAVCELKDLTGTGHNEIKLKVCTNRRIVTEAIEKYKKTHPEVNFSISHNYADEGEFDFIISDTAPLQGEHTKELLITEKYVLAARRDSHISGVRNIHSLKNERFITMQSQSSLWRCTEEICRENGFEPNIVITSDDPFYVRQYIELGLGIAFVPSFSWQGQFSDNVCLIDICDYKRDTFVFCPNDRYVPQSLKNFKDVLMQTCKHK